MKSVIGTKRRRNPRNTCFIINNKRIDNELQIGNEFNKYFVSVGQTLAANLKPTSLNPIDFLQMNPHSMVFTHIEEIELVTIINSLNNSSPGCDGIPAVQRVMHFYIKPLTLIINKAFYDGVSTRNLN